LFFSILFCALLGMVFITITKSQLASSEMPFSTPVLTRATLTPTSFTQFGSPTGEVLKVVAPATPAANGVMGFYVNWDENSFSSLKQHINNIDKLIPEWLHLADSNGGIAADDLVVQQKTLDFIKSARPNLPIVALVNNYNNETQDWDASRLVLMLNRPAARARNIKALLDFIQKNNFQGINIDYESVPPGARVSLTTYMKELYELFHPIGLDVSQSVPVNDPGFDYPNLEKYVDYLILMIYDEHWSTSMAGPVASQQMFADALTYHLSNTDPSKYVIGIGNYGYDWIDGTRQGTEISIGDATRIAQERNVKVIIDPASKNPSYDYTDGQGRLHHVWFLDATTAKNEIMQTHPYMVRDLALWRMGSEDPAIWQLFGDKVNP
jgi:spore germination protein YaaH